MKPDVHGVALCRQLHVCLRLGNGFALAFRIAPLATSRLVEGGFHLRQTELPPRRVHDVHLPRRRRLVVGLERLQDELLHLGMVLWWLRLATQEAREEARGEAAEEQRVDVERLAAARLDHVHPRGELADDALLPL